VGQAGSAHQLDGRKPFFMVQGAEMLEQDPSEAVGSPALVSCSTERTRP